MNLLNGNDMELLEQKLGRKLKEMNFKSNDTNLIISIFEQFGAWKKLNDEKIIIIQGIDTNDNNCIFYGNKKYEPYYIFFDKIDKEDIEEYFEDNYEDIKDTCGYTNEQMKQFNLNQKIQESLLHGYSIYVIGKRISNWNEQFDLDEKPINLEDNEDYMIMGNYKILRNEISLNDLINKIKILEKGEV